MRLLARWIALSGAALACALSPVTAQETGSRIGTGPASIRDGRQTVGGARRWLDAFAECVISRWPSRVRTYLDTFPGSARAGQLGRALASQECISTGQAQFNEQLFRWALYERLYHDVFRRSGPADFSAVPGIDYAAGANDAELASNTVPLRQFADCVSRSAPTASRELILSPVGTQVEQSAFAAITPHLQGCLPKEVTLSFSKSVLRGLIGETLYRLSIASQPAAQKG